MTSNDQESVNQSQAAATATTSNATTSSSPNQINFDMAHFDRTLVVIVHFLVVVAESLKHCSPEETFKLKKLVYELIKLNPKNSKQSTLLHLASSRDSSSIIKNHTLSSFPSTEVLKLLLECGADPNSLDGERNSPLHLAASNRHSSLTNSSQSTSISAQPPSSSSSANAANENNNNNTVNLNNNNNNNNNNHRVNNINNNMNQNTRINSNISTAITNTNETSRNMNGKCEKESQVSIEYYKCPFCFYKHMNKLVMRKHLAFHFNVNKKVIPHFKCSLCKFKSLWQHTVKNHCMKSHLGSSNVKVLRITNSNHFNTDYSIDRSNEEEIENNCNTNNNNNNTSANNATSYTNTNNNNNNANSTNMKNNIQINGNNLNGYHDEHDNEQDLDNNDDDVQNENRMNHTIHDLASFNNSISNNHEDGEDKREESIILTGFDGVKFAATYLVSASSAATNNTSLNLNSLINTNKKKMYYCQTCPYKTSNNCNLKQHLVQHRYHEGFFKCRYCTYYVSMVRLLKQHEILHPEFEPRDSGKQPTKSSSSNLLNNNYASTIVVSNGIKNEFE